jgi:hypothetical protein
LDSIDLFVGINSSTISGGGWNTAENLLKSDWLRQFPGGQRFLSFDSWKNMKYAGLPHIGFAYSFGSQGTQYVRSEYQQNFGSNVMLNIDFDKKRSNGQLRNANFDHNNIQLLFLKKGKLYSLELKGSFESSNVSQNGGLVTDTLSNDFPIAFIPVYKSSAQTRTERTRLFATNYFDFNKDSIVAIGLFTDHKLKIKKYEYTEVDTLYGIYPVVNNDSTRTYDQHQWSQIGNGAGVFFKNKNTLVKIGLEEEYWSFQNMGKFNDTIEIDLNANVYYSTRTTKISNFFVANVLGAQNEVVNDFKVSYLNRGIKYFGSALYENRLPEYYQRFAFGNNYLPPTSAINKQQLIDLKLGAGRSLGKHYAEIKYSFSSAKNNYWFVDSVWRNDTLSSLTFQSLNLRGDFKFGIFSLQPNYTFTMNDKNCQVIPAHQFQTRLFIKGGLFKAKKMIAYIGVDLAAFSSFSRIGYSSLTSTFQPQMLSASTKGWTNAHFFTGFQIDEFKFYIRMENLGYFWNDHNMETFIGYPLTATQLRLGITWDFFN